MRVLLALLLLVPLASAQTPPEAQAPERHPLRSLAQADLAQRSEATAAFDATYYHLRLALDFDAERLTGTTRAEGTLTAAADELRLDLLGNMDVAAVRDGDGAPLAFTHAGDVLAIALGRTVLAGGRVAVEVDYAGRPQASGFGAFAFAERGGRPVAWTLSEPYGSRAWWPGKDHPSDKADSARVTVTVPAGLRVGSNGRLVGVEDAGRWVTYDWAVRYPIAPYLLSLAVGPYEAFEQTYTRPDSLAATLGPLALPVLHYVYPTGGTTTLPSGWAEVLDALPVFEWWFGAYPFPAEKYGHAHFGWGGGMEHQTMSSMGGTSVGLMTHELAHQWFGDAVTTRTWPHLWLNEGFASYAEILYWEAQADRYPGYAASTLQGDQDRARSAQGTLVVQDTLRVSNLFASSRVYAKGSAVLHMLRRVLGDEAFRATLQAYLADPALAYGTAVTADLQRVAEAVAGRSLDAFFRQWVTEGTGYPIYALDTRSAPAPDGGYDVTVTVRQTQTVPASNVAVFAMPVTLAVETLLGEERFVVENTARAQTYVLHVAAEPLAVRFDPDGDLLRNPSVPVDGEADGGAVAFRLAATPNPARGVLRLHGRLPTTGALRVDLVDLLGRRVRTLHDALTPAGPLAVAASTRGLPAGTYVLVARHPDGTWSDVVTVVP